MRHARTLISSACLVLFLCLSGAALAYDHTAPGRPSDAETQSAVMDALLKENAEQAAFIKVYSFQGHVFMTGEPETSFGLYAERTAHYARASHFVTAHWFPPKTSDPNLDPGVRANVISRLSPVMRDPNNIVVEVWGGNVVLFGVVQNPEDSAQALALLKAVPGMKSLRSYLMTSEQAMKAIGNPSELYQK
jgi:hyperosmotically inducible protein